MMCNLSKIVCYKSWLLHVWSFPLLHLPTRYVPLFMPAQKVSKTLCTARFYMEASSAIVFVISQQFGRILVIAHKRTIRYIQYPFKCLFSL
jgi:hypothetical protein